VHAAPVINFRNVRCATGSVFGSSACARARPKKRYRSLSTSPLPLPASRRARRFVKNRLNNYLYPTANDTQSERNNERYSFAGRTSCPGGDTRKMYLERARLQAWPTKYKIVFYDYSTMNILIENKNIILRAHECVYIYIYT